MCKVLQSFLDTCCAAFITLSSLERVADQLHPRTSSHGQKVQSGCCCQARQTSCPSQTPCFEAVLGVPESEVCSWRSRCAGSWHPLGPCDLESFHCWSPEGIWQKDSIRFYQSLKRMAFCPNCAASFAPAVGKAPCGRKPTRTFPSTNGVPKLAGHLHCHTTCIPFSKSHQVSSINLSKSRHRFYFSSWLAHLPLNADCCWDAITKWLRACALASSPCAACTWRKRRSKLLLAMAKLGWTSKLMKPLLIGPMWPRILRTRMPWRRASASSGSSGRASSCVAGLPLWFFPSTRPCQWRGPLAQVPSTRSTGRLWQTNHLANRQVVLHTDSAKSYRAKVKGVLHDTVVHCKKKHLVKGKAKWAAPQYVRVVSHKLPGGKVLKVKAGTQHIDRAWRFLKDRLCLNQHVKAGTKAIRNRIRSAQYEYWHRGSDLWLHTGILVKEAMSHYVHKI